MVNAKQSEGKPVKFADIHSVVDYKADLYDGVHPNEQGYEKMGKYWSEVIESELSGEIPSATETTTTTTTNTTETETTTATEPIVPEKNYSISDAVRLSEYLLCKYEITPEDDFDINSDGAINIFDLVTLKRILKNK